MSQETETRLPFAGRPCPKCTDTDVKLCFCRARCLTDERGGFLEVDAPALGREPREDEHLHWTCATCGYVWLTWCADSPHAELTFGSGPITADTVKTLHDQLRT